MLSSLCCDVRVLVGVCDVIDLNWHMLAGWMDGWLMGYLEDQGE